MIPFRHESDFAYLEKVERQAQIARAEHSARLIGDLYVLIRGAVRAALRGLKPAHDEASGAAGRRAA